LVKARIKKDYVESERYVMQAPDLALSLERSVSAHTAADE
jgi:hypothetical protein